MHALPLAPASRRRSLGLLLLLLLLLSHKGFSELGEVIIQLFIL